MYNDYDVQIYWLVHEKYFKFKYFGFPFDKTNESSSSSLQSLEKRGKTLAFNFP